MGARAHDLNRRKVGTSAASSETMLAHKLTTIAPPTGFKNWIPLTMFASDFNATPRAIHALGLLEGSSD